AIALQNPGTDCMRMVDHFLCRPLDLSRLVSAAASGSTDFEARLETIPAQVRTADLRTACEVAEVMLNSRPVPPRPSWNDVERYVKEHFAQADGGFQFSCDQDFLRVCRAA